MNASNSTKNEIGEKIQKWKFQKGYLKASVTLAELCDELEVNRTYLSNYINERYRKSFNNWINTLRIKEAKIIINANQTMPLTDVAVRVGFTDLAHFSKRFKEQVGQTPSAWKKELIALKRAHRLNRKAAMEYTQKMH